MIFKSFKLNNTKLKNRIVVSPMCQYSAKSNGCPTSWHYYHLANMVNSGAGMITIESCAVSKSGRISDKDLCLFNNNQEKHLKKLLKYLKKLKKVPIVLQISHSGRKGSSHIPGSAKKGPLKKNEGSWQTISASSLKKDIGWPKPKLASKKDIKKIIKQFVNTASRAKRVGFDGLEIHMAHGYLIHQFLSPISNLRIDDYGGKFENRIKIATEIISQIKEVWPKNKILGARITGTDHLKKGILVKESCKFVKILEKLKLNYVCVSSGGIITKTKMKNNKMGFRINVASAIKKNTNLPVRTSGNLRNLKSIKHDILNKKYDFIAIARPFLKNPYWLFNDKNFLKIFKKDLPKQIYRGFLK